MTNRMIFRLSMAALIAVVILGLITSFFTPANCSGTNRSKESMPTCTEKNGVEPKGEADVEPLSGKFFSSFSY